MRRAAVLDIVAAFVVPLVPATILYALFASANSAEVVQKDGVKLGGPAAFYFVLLVLALRYMNRWRHRADPIERLRTDLLGTWDVASTSGSGSGRTATSVATFDVQDDVLSLKGGKFVERGVLVGTWRPEHLILDPSSDEVIFIYDLTDASADNEWRGLMELTLDRSGALRMDGTWEVVGPNHHHGTAVFTKRAPTA